MPQPFGDPGSQPKLEALQKTDAPQQRVGSNNINKFNPIYLKGNGYVSTTITHTLCGRLFL